MKFKKKRSMQEGDIDLDELLKKKQNGAIIIDVRNKREYSEGHIEGSINIPEYEINKSFKEKFLDKNTEFVFYCLSGYRSMKACKKIKKIGYKNVFNLYGGLENY